MEAPRLPRAVEDEPIAARLGEEWVARSRPLWQRGVVGVPGAGLGVGVALALRSAYSAGRLVRGLENAREALAAERRGLARVDRETGVARGGRVSRLLVVSDDGAERFYRDVESLLHEHAPRVLALRLSEGERPLGETLFGAGARARLVMVAHKEAVAAVLLALAEQWSGPS